MKLAKVDAMVRMVAAAGAGVVGRRWRGEGGADPKLKQVLTRGSV